MRLQRRILFSIVFALCCVSNSNALVQSTYTLSDDLPWTPESTRRALVPLDYVRAGLDFLTSMIFNSFEGRNVLDLTINYMKNASGNILEGANNDRIWMENKISARKIYYNIGYSDDYYFLPAGKYFVYDVVASLFYSGKYIAYVYNGSEIGYDDYDIIKPSTTKYSEDQYFSLTSAPILSAFDMSELDIIDSDYAKINDFSLLLGYVLQTNINCNQTFIKKDESSGYIQLLKNLKTGVITSTTDWSLSFKNENLEPAGTIAPAAALTSPPVSSGVSFAEVSSGTTTAIAKQGCSSSSVYADKDWNGMKVLQGNYNKVINSLNDNSLAEAMQRTSSYPYSNEYLVNRACIFCTINILKSFWENEGSWSSFKNWRTYIDGKTGVKSCSDFLNLPDSHEKKERERLMDSIIKYVGSENSSDSVVEDPSKGILFLLSRSLYDMNNQLQPQIAVAAYNFSNKYFNSSQANLFDLDFPSVPFLLGSYDITQDDCKYDFMKNTTQKLDSSQGSGSTVPTENEVLKDILLDKMTAVDQGELAAGFQPSVPDEVDIVINKFNIPAIDQVYIVRNGRVMLYATQESTDGVVKYLSSQKDVKWTNEYFIDSVKDDKKIYKNKWKADYAMLMKQIQQNNIQRMLLAYNTQLAHADSIKNKLLETLSSSGASVQSSPICTVSQKQMLQKTFSWRTDIANDYLGEVLVSLEGEKFNSYQSFLEGNGSLDAQRDMAFSLAVKLYKQYIEHNMLENMIVFESSMLLSKLAEIQKDDKIPEMIVEYEKKVKKYLYGASSEYSSTDAVADVTTGTKNAATLPASAKASNYGPSFYKNNKAKLGS